MAVDTSALTTTSPAMMMTMTMMPEMGNMTTPALGPQTPSSSFSSALAFFRVALTLQRIWPPVIFCLGTLGNVMTVVIMRRLTSSSSEDSTIHIYFTAIAVADLLYLWTIVLDQVLQYNVGIDIKTVHGAFCKVFTWLYTGGGTVSCWYLVCMTAHRAVSVVWPHRVSLLCTRRTVVVLLASVTGVVAVLYSHYLYGVDTLYLDDGTTFRCARATPEYAQFHSNVFTYIEVCVYSAVPFLVLMFANGVLARRLVASFKTTLTTTSSLTSGSSSGQREKAARSVTLTVMAVSLAFLVLTLPSGVNFILHHEVLGGKGQMSQEGWFRMLAVTFMCTLVSHTNHAVNFYLYCLTGRRFREEFFRILCCGRAGSRAQGRSGKDQAASG